MNDGAAVFSDGPVLTRDERAYRRGALQAIQFLLADLKGRAVPLGLLMRVGSWEQALVAGRGSEDPAYLGKYLDEVRRRVD